MRVMRVALATVAAMLILGMPVQAAYESVDFTELGQDTTGENAPFWDIVSIAIGEPGDGTFVLVGRIASLPAPDDGMGRLFFGFDAAGQMVVSGATYAGAPATRNIGEPIAPASCTVDEGEGLIFCAYFYESVGVAIGDEISNPFAFIDGCAPGAGCVPVDNAPGSGAGVADWQLKFSTSYVLTGCTVPTGCALEGGETRTIWQQIDAPAFTHAFTNATSDTYVMNFTTDLINSTANFTWDASNGTVNATLADANGTVVFEGAFEGNGSLAQDLVAAPGDWNLTLVYDGFVGDFSFDLGPIEVLEEEVPVGTPEPEANETIELDDVDQEAPLPLLAPLTGVLVALGLRRRH